MKKKGNLDYQTPCVCVCHFCVVGYYRQTLIVIKFSNKIDWCVVTSIGLFFLFFLLCWLVDGGGLYRAADQSMNRLWVPIVLSNVFILSMFVQCVVCYMCSYQLQWFHSIEFHQQKKTNEQELCIPCNSQSTNSKTVKAVFASIGS